MRKIYILLLFISFISAHAQIVTISDPDFKAMLISNFDYNSDGEIQLSEAQETLEISLTDNSGSVQSIDGIQSFSNLTDLHLTNFSQLASIPNLSGMTSLQEFTLTNAPASGILDFTAASGLNYVEITGTNVTEAHFGSSLEQMLLANNALTNVTFPGFDMMGSIDLSDNPLTNFDWDQLSDLELVNVVVTDFPGTSLVIEGTHLSGLNLTIGGPNLEYLKLPGNTQYEDLNIISPNLEILDMKNYSADGCFSPSGSICQEEWEINLNTPNLQLICVDDLVAGGTETGDPLSEADYFEGLVSNSPNVSVSTYCAFETGINTISGSVNLNCGASQSEISGIRINTATPQGQFPVFSNENGQYLAYSGAGNVTLTPQLENPSWFTVTPASQVVSFPAGINDATVDFCISPVGVHHDVTIEILPITPARPGFQAVYEIVYKNNGNQPATGTANFTYDSTRMAFLSSQPAPTQQNAGTVSWDYALGALESASAVITVLVNTPSATPSVNIGDLLEFTSSITSVETDEIPANNTKDFVQTVIGSFDPNDKQVVEGSTVSIAEVGDYLTYIVRFQNTGTAPAENVVVRDVIANNLNIATLQVIGASHDYQARIVNGRQAEFIFEGIDLPAASTDQAASNGYVAFKIKPASTVGLNQSVENTADIFFDFNLPIETNTVSTTFTNLSKSDFEKAVFLLYPNPAGGQLNISSDDAVISLEIMNVIGQTVKIVNFTQNVTSVDVSGLSSGVYFAKVKTNIGTAIKKFIKK